MKAPFRWGLILASALLVVVTLSALPAQAAPQDHRVIQTMWLDTYADVDRNPDPGSIPPPLSFSQYPLQAGWRYTLIISGTFSVWSPNDWIQQGVTGPEEASPTYPSPDTASGMVGWDAEYAFAYPTGYLNWSLPFHQVAVQMSVDGGATWTHREPLRIGYRSNHTYFYTVVGQGAPWPLVGGWELQGQLRHVEVCHCARGESALSITPWGMVSSLGHPRARSDWSPERE